MGAKGEIREEKSSWERHIGFVEIKRVVALNPTIEERNKLFNVENSDDDEEIQYTSETEPDDDGKKYKKIRLDFYYETHNPALGIKRYSVFLVNKEKRGRKNPDAYQWVNQTGTCSYAETEDQLPEWFTHFQDREKNNIGEKSVRIALEGEEMLMTFLRALINFTYDKVGAELIYNYKKMFAGDVKELRADVTNEEITHAFTGLLSVQTSEDGTKQYEVLFGKMFLPSGIMKNINLGGSFSDKWLIGQWNKFVKEATGEYGAKGFTKLQEAALYNPKDDISTSNSTKKEASATSSEY